MGIDEDTRRRQQRTIDERKRQLEKELEESDKHGHTYDGIQARQRRTEEERSSKLLPRPTPPPEKQLAPAPPRPVPSPTKAPPPTQEKARQPSSSTSNVRHLVANRDESYKRIAKTLCGRIITNNRRFLTSKNDDVSCPACLEHMSK